MIIKNRELITIKVLKNLVMYYDTTNHEIVLGKDGETFTIAKSEIFPVLRGIVSATQRFYRRTERKEAK